MILAKLKKLLILLDVLLKILYISGLVYLFVSYKIGECVCFVVTHMLMNVWKSMLRALQSYGNYD